MKMYRYIEWDGSQGLVDLGKDDFMKELERHLMAHGDLDHALWKIQREGVQVSQGRRLIH